MPSTYDQPNFPAVRPTDPQVPKACSFAAANDLLKNKELISATHIMDWELMGGTLLTIDGPEHRARRRTQSVLFKPGNLHQYESAVLQPAIELALKKVARTGRGPDGIVRADLVRLGRLVMLAITGALIGLDDIDDDTRRDRLGDCADALIEGILVEWATHNPDEIMTRAREWKEIYDEEFVAPALNRRRELLATGEAADDSSLDLLTVLLADTTQNWTDEAVLRECILYLVASTLTTSTAMTHTFVHLDEWFTSHPEDIEKAKDADFLRAATRESLRLHPGPHVLLRRAVEPTPDVVQGVSLEAAEVIGADLRQGNVDPEVYENPTEFNPYREPRVGAPAEGLTFGGGRHICIGRPLALGTYGGRDAQEVDGILVRMLRALYAAGITPDPDRPGRKAQSEHDRYEVLPVILRHP